MLELVDGTFTYRNDPIWAFRRHDTRCGLSWSSHRSSLSLLAITILKIEICKCQLGAAVTHKPWQILRHHRHCLVDHSGSVPFIAMSIHCLCTVLSQNHIWNNERHVHITSVSVIRSTNIDDNARKELRGDSSFTWRQLMLKRSSSKKCHVSKAARNLVYELATHVRYPSTNFVWYPKEFVLIDRSWTSMSSVASGGISPMPFFPYACIVGVISCQEGSCDSEALRQWQHKFLLAWGIEISSLFNEDQEGLQ